MKDVSFEVGDKLFETFNEAAGHAVSLAASGKEDVSIDVLIYSEDGAREWGGDSAVEDYWQDPDASVSERIIVRAESIGRVA